MGILSTGQREDIHTYWFRDVQERYGDKVEMVFPEQCVWRFPHDHARNAYVDDFLASDCDLLFFLDSDVCPPKHLFDLLVHANYSDWKVAGAPYPLWMPAARTTENTILFTSYDGVVQSTDGGNTGIRMTECPRDGQKFVDAIATGCMFIKREVFSQLEKPYFEFKFHPVTRNVIEGEDLGFCLKLNKLGIKCFIDYGMVCKHYKRVCLLDMNNYAVSLANSKLLDYDREIRAQIQPAIDQAIEKGRQMGLREARASAQQPPKSPLILPSSYGR